VSLFSRETQGKNSWLPFDEGRGEGAYVGGVEKITSIVEKGRSIYIARGGGLGAGLRAEKKDCFLYQIEARKRFCSFRRRGREKRVGDARGK